MDVDWSQIIVTIVVSVFASSGFWGLIQMLASKRDVKTRMLIGLGHDRIIELGMQYIKRDWITNDEYENLYEYLYKPYEEMGGNGSAKRVMEAVNKLDIRVVPLPEPGSGSTKKTNHQTTHPNSK